MVNGPTVIADFLEPFVLGISCIVGGEQFSILLSHTNVSLKIQSFILIVVCILTIITSAFVDAEYSLFNGFHCYYAVLTIFLHLLVSEGFKSVIIITIMTICIGFVVSFLIIQSCSHYFTSRMQLSAFIYGLFISRSLPYMCWYFVNKNIPYESQLYSVANSLGSFRIIFCFFSMSIKIFLGRFKFSTARSDPKTNRGLLPFLSESFKDFVNTDNYLWIPTRYHFTEKSSWFIFPFPSFLLYCFFMLSVLVYSAFPSLIHSIYSVYSINMISLLTMIRAISHLFGSCFGIAFPFSTIGNFSFLVITGLSYIIVLLNLFFYYKFYDLPIFYSFELLTGFSLGYLWSYTLGIIVNTSLNKTCIHQDHKPDCCCGDKITNECYCRLPFIIRELKSSESKFKVGLLPFDLGPTSSKPSKTLFPCSKAATPSEKSLSYSKESKNAVIIFVGKDILDTLQKESLEADCKSGSEYECLRLIDVFILDSVTTNSCPKCQLTVRLEARRNTDSLRCKSCSMGENCTCSTSGTKCCCIKFDCCSASCKKEKCKVHFCCCNKECKHCVRSDKPEDNEKARLFMCFRSETNKCSLKEIKPNDPTDFDGDFNIINEFDISCMFFSNCCHVDFQVDLYCTMKNNFFRLTGINFQNKYSPPTSILLKNSNAKCIHKKDPECCCAYRDLVRLSLSHDASKLEKEVCKPLNETLEASGGTGHTGVTTSSTPSTRCPSICHLQVDKLDSFFKKIYPNREKLVVFCLLVYGMLFFTTFLTISITRASKQPYLFEPGVGYLKLSGAFSSNKFNHSSQIVNRLYSLNELSKLSDDVYRQKLKELKRMSAIFKIYLGESVGSRVLQNIDNSAHSFLSSYNNPEFKRFDIEIIKWSHAVGLMYKYVFLHFFKIQKYFALWERNWAIEYKNYRKSIGLNIDQMSLKSKFSLTLLNDAKLSENKFNTIGLSRLVTWNKVLKEVRLYSTLIEKELQLSVEALPMKLGTRLEHFIQRWDHRVENIVHWSKRRTNIYDWSNFLRQYNTIKDWVNDVSPYLKGNSDVKFPIKDLNSGTKVFGEYKID